MKRLILILFTLILLVFCGGCDAENNESARVPVKINMPADDTVNGYRTGSRINSTNSDTIDANKVTVESKPQSENKPSDSVSVTVSKTENSYETQSEAPKEIQYCANLKSKVFHKSDCGSVKNMKEENKFFSKDKNMLTEMGYTPCNNCKP